MMTVTASLKSMVAECQSAVFFVRDLDAEGTLTTHFADSPHGDYLRTLALPDDAGLLGRAIGSRSAILSRGSEESPLASEQSAVVAPLLVNVPGEGLAVLGCFYAGALEKGALREEHRLLIETVAFQAALALGNARLRDELQLMALTDRLTGLFSFRFFQEKLREEIEFAQRHRQSVVLVLLDVDHFMRFNDKVGHQAGDTLLKEMALLLKSQVGDGAMMARTGGDEFALLLQGRREDEVLPLCERIREAFQSRFASHEITVSIGVAYYPDHADSEAKLRQAADEAVYASKRGGRNRVTSL
jgi:diguanylate cyclase (GGDEF)-like protein